jgi:hypothetical protein
MSQNDDNPSSRRGLDSVNKNGINPQAPHT